MKVCRTCLIEKPLTDFYRESRSKVKEYRKADCKRCYSAKVLKRYKDEPEKARERHWQRKLGVGTETYNTLLAFQDRSCRICHKSEDELPQILRIDHCHDTGKIRGLLCNRCNLALGLFGDSINVLEGAILYLKTSLTSKDKP